MDISKAKFTEEDFGNLCLPSEELLQQVKYRYLATRDIVQSNRIVIHRELSPANLYLYLLARYGSPNGVLSQVRRDEPQAQRTLLWHYTLKWRKRHLHIVCHHFRIDLIFGPGPEVEVTSEEFVTFVRNGFVRYKKQLGEAKKQVERYRSFLNPLSHMLDAIKRLLAKAEDLDHGLVKSRAHPVTLEDISWHHVNQEKHSLAASELSGCCLSVKMMSPVASRCL